MRKIRRITKRHIGKFFKFYYDNGTRTYEYICGIADIADKFGPTYSYIGYFFDSTTRMFHEADCEADCACAHPSVGYWLPVSELEVAVVVPELLERAEKWKQK